MYTWPPGLLLLLAIPVIVALHLYRRRHAPRPVSAVFLWEPLDRSASAGRRREPLRRTTSLLLELLAAALLALAAAGPRRCGEVRHHVIVLDDSASMGAQTAEGDTAALARAAVEALLEQAARADRVSLIRSGASPAVVAGPEASLAEARAALDGWTPRSASHDLGPALALGRSLARGGPVWLVTDGPAEAPPDVGVLAVGHAADNPAVISAARARTAEGEVLSLVLASPHAGAQVSLSGEGLPTAALALPADAPVSWTLPLPEGAPPLTLRLRRTDGGQDALEIDDVVWLAPAPRRTLTLGSDLPEDLRLRLGLGADLARWRGLVPDSAIGDAATADLVITAAAQDRWSLVLAAPASAPGRALTGPMLLARDHPLLDGVTGEGWIATPASGAPAAGLPLVRAADGVVLLGEEELPTARRVTLNLDPARSSLARHPDWPVLLLNLAERCRDALPGPRRTTLAAGEAFVSPGAGPGPFHVEGGPAEVAVVADTLSVRAPPGLYTVRDAEEQEVARFAVNLVDATESDLADRRTFRRAPKASGASTTLAEGPSTLLALGALAAVLLDAFVLRREGGR